MTWSSELQNQTRQILEEMAHVPHDDKIYLKHDSGTFGYIEIGDWFQQTWIVHQRGNKDILQFDSVDDLIEAGWVVD